jgi:hypothetical protein
VAKTMHLKEAKLFPYLRGALVNYSVWQHPTSRGGFSEKETVTGIVTDVKYKALGSGKIIYAIFYIASGPGIDRVHHDDPHFRVMQLADGTTFPEEGVSRTEDLRRALSRLWHADQKKLLGR